MTKLLFFLILVIATIVFFMAKLNLNQHHQLSDDKTITYVVWFGRITTVKFFDDIKGVLLEEKTFSYSRPYEHLNLLSECSIIPEEVLKDTNYDGMFDIKEVYQVGNSITEGRLLRTELDLDYDGVFETVKKNDHEEPSSRD